jgi:hypothetical protein
VKAGENGKVAEIAKFPFARVCEGAAFGEFGQVAVFPILPKNAKVSISGKTAAFLGAIIAARVGTILAGRIFYLGPWVC